MPSPLLIHSISETEYSHGIVAERDILTSGELSHQSSSTTRKRSSFIVPSRWSSTHITSYPNFFRLGALADIKHIGVGRDSVVLGLDARVLLDHKFQLNVGWYPNQLVRQHDKDCIDKVLAHNALNGIIDPDINSNIKVGDILYPERVSGTGAVVDGRTIGEADLLLKLKELDTSQRYAYGLNGAGRSADKNWAGSNEILVDGPVSLKERLNIVFISDKLPPTYAAKIREIVSSKYPHARVKEHTST
jgi:hypothetical protein